MADGDFTQSDRCALQLTMDQAFVDSPNQVAANRAAVTAQALAAEQRGRIDQNVWSDANNCAGASVSFMKTGDTVAYSGAISGDSVSCDLGDCNEGEAVSVDIKPDNWVRACVSVSTDTCSSVLDYATRRSSVLGKAVSDIRIAFDKIAIAFLAANEQDNLYAGVSAIDLGNGPWGVDTGGAIIGVPAPDLHTPEGLAAAEQVVMGNYIMDHFWVHGNAWYDANFLSSFADQNIGCCDHTVYRMFAGGRHYWDLMYMDSELTPNGNSFAVSPGSYMFVPFNRAPSTTPMLVSPTDGMYRFSIQDPNWVWSNGGSMLPVPYNVLMQRKCTGRNAVGDPIFQETYEVTLNYALVAAPADELGSTGILHFADAAGLTLA